MPSTTCGAARSAITRSTRSRVPGCGSPHGQCGDRSGLVEGQMHQKRCDQAARAISQPVEDPASDSSDQDDAQYRLTLGTRVGNVGQPESGGLQQPSAESAECVGADG